MNKRIIIVDDSVQSPIKFVGIGLGQDIFSVSDLSSMDQEKANEILDLKTGDAAMLIGGKAFEFLKDKDHF